ncbi:hypothetical protein C9Z24_10130 [Escherichia coli]|nr:hypothetical protein BWI83_13230 [Escherichia coli]EAA1145059.1 hypothetical protein [Shigella flexneri]EFN7785230.1 hypothetical protein [Escherichia coli]EFO2614898.1 hypothetical protein [Escherichia coli]EFO3874091.1 hypothetical protein [Escherichia coli]
MQTTIKIPEVLIGEIIRYALRTLSLAPTCADAQVFFSHLIYCRSRSLSRVISLHSLLLNQSKGSWNAF